MKIPSDIVQAALAAGFDVEYRSLTYVKGWPTKSSKPYLLRRDGRTRSFATVQSLGAAIAASPGPKSVTPA